MRRLSKISLVFIAVLSALLIAACGGEKKPSAEELFNQASANDAASITVNGTLDYSAKESGDTTNFSLPFKMVADTDTQAENAKVKISVAGYTFISDQGGQIVYLAKEGKAVRLDVKKFQKEAEKQSRELSDHDITTDHNKDTKYLREMALNLGQELAGETKNTIAGASDVNDGDQINGQETWKVTVNLDQVDYKNTLESYSKILSRVLTEELGKTEKSEGLSKELEKLSGKSAEQVQTEMEKSFSKTLAEISDEDYTKAKKVAELIKIDTSFYKESGDLAAINFNFTTDTKDLVGRGLLDPESEEAKEDESVLIGLKLDFVYSDSPAEINIPVNAVDSESLQGKKDLTEMFGELPNPLEMLFGAPRTQSAKEAISKQNTNTALKIVAVHVADGTINSSTKEHEIISLINKEGVPESSVSVLIENGMIFISSVDDQAINGSVNLKTGRIDWNF